MIEVAFDESGNSGENLLDPAQPVYTLASVARLETEVAGPVAELLDSRPYAELKFSQLRMSREGRQILAASSSLAFSIHKAPASFPSTRTG